MRSARLTRRSACCGFTGPVASARRRCSAGSPTRRPISVARRWCSTCGRSSRRRRLSRPLSRPISPSACGRPASTSASSVFAGLERPVLLLDTFEAAPGLEDWLREVFVPALPAGALTVIAGRAQPGDEWRRDPGWRDLLRVVSLRNLGPDDARALLRRAGVADESHERMLELTHGHPLALSLLLDVRSLDDDASLDLSAVPDVVGRLVASFLAGVPSPRHRLALELAAHARFTTAGLLRAALGDDGELFAWLRGLSFIESGPARAVPARSGARRDRRRPALARSGGLQARARARAPPRGRAADVDRRIRAPARAGRSDVPASRQPGRPAVLGLGEPRPGVRRRAARQ